MAEQQWLDVISFRKRGEKTFAHKIGSAKRGDKGINVYLDSLPLPDADGRVSLLISVRQERGGGSAPPRTQQRKQEQEDDPFDSDIIPF